MAAYFWCAPFAVFTQDGGGGEQYAKKNWICASQAMTIMRVAGRLDDPQIFSRFQFCGISKIGVFLLCRLYGGRGAKAPLFVKNRTASNEETCLLRVGSWGVS